MERERGWNGRKMERGFSGTVGTGTVVERERGWNGNGVERGSRGTVGTGTVEIELALGALGYGNCQEPDSD